MATHNICLYKVVDKKYTGCDLKTTELLDCVLIGACAVIRLNTVYTVGHWNLFEVNIPCLCATIFLIIITSFDFQHEPLFNMAEK